MVPATLDWMETRPASAGGPGSQAPTILCRFPVSRTMVELAQAVTAGRQGRLVVIRDAEVPRQTPLASVTEADPGIEVELDEAVARIRSKDLDAEGVVWLGHDATRNLTSAAKEHGAGIILLDTENRASLNEAIDAGGLAKRASVPVADVRARQPGFKPSSLLVPVVPGPNADLAVHLAGMVAQHLGIAVELLHVLPAEPSAREVHLGERFLASRLLWLDDRVDTRTTLATCEDVTDGILSRAEGHGAMIVGGTRRGWLKRLVQGTVPDVIQERADIDVLEIHAGGA